MKVWREERRFLDVILMALSLERILLFFCWIESDDVFTFISSWSWSVDEFLNRFFFLLLKLLMSKTYILYEFNYFKVINFPFFFLLVIAGKHHDDVTRIHLTFFSLNAKSLSYVTRQNSIKQHTKKVKFLLIILSWWQFEECWRMHFMPRVSHFYCKFTYFNKCFCFFFSFFFCCLPRFVDSTS